VIISKIAKFYQKVQGIVGINNCILMNLFDMCVKDMCERR
jgi:hypothetical protein